MSRREAALMRRDRLVVATALAVLGILALGFSYYEFNRTVAGAAGTDFHDGNVDLLTDDTQARATVRVRFTADYRAHVTDNPLVVDVEVTSHQDDLAFALVLGGDAARTGIEARSTSVLPRGQGRAHGDLWVQGDVLDAWFVDSAGPSLPDLEPTPVGAVVVGHAHRSKRGEPIRMSMIIPTTGSFVRDTPTGFEFYMPTVGSGAGWFDDLTLRARADGDAVIAQATALIDDVAWQPPMAVDGEVELSELRENDRVDATPPATKAPRGLRTWQGQGPLEVTGIVDRAEDLQKAQKRQFLAGAAVGLGGALVVWSLEVFLEVSLDARRARRAEAEGADDEPGDAHLATEV